MYRGVNIGVRVYDYASACTALEERCQALRGFKDGLYPGGPDVPLGHPRRNVTGIRQLRDESIACRLYCTDVVTWHPDNSVSVISHPTVTTGHFANALLPSALRLGGENQVMTFFPGVPDDAGWQKRWPAVRVCHGDGTYRIVDDTWVPDESTLRPMTYVEYDKAAVRAVCREHPFAKFKAWLEMASNVMEIDHEGEDYAVCAAALAAGEYLRAAKHLPTVVVPNGFGARQRLKPLRMQNVRYDNPVTLGSVEYLRRWLYVRAEAIVQTAVTTMSLQDRERQVALQNQLARAGARL